MASAASVQVTQWRKMLGYVSLPPPPPLGVAARQAAAAKSAAPQHAPGGAQRGAQPSLQPPPAKVLHAVALLPDGGVHALRLLRLGPYARRARVRYLTRAGSAGQRAPASPETAGLGFWGSGLNPRPSMSSQVLGPAEDWCI